MRWSGPIAREGVETSDHRTIKPGALIWETPLPVMSNVDGLPSSIVGRVDEVERDGGVIRASGVIDGVPAGSHPVAVRIGETETIVEGSDLTPRYRFETGRILGLFLTTDPAWADCRIEVVE